LINVVGVLKVSEFCISIGAVKHGVWWQLHRVLTSNFVHGGILHSLLNSLAMLSLGAQREQQVGSIAMLLSSFGMCMLGGVGQVALGAAFEALSASITRNEDALLNQLLAPQEGVGCAVGLSGLLFSLLVLRFAAPENRSQSVK
jgi:membrane associated rhomboid family serine protease